MSRNQHGIRVMQSRNLSKRARLFREFRVCFWCGCQTSLGVPMSNPIAASIDHLFSRLHPWRKDGRPSPVVLACMGCNAERGQCDVNLTQFVPKLSDRNEIAIRASCVNAAAKPNQWREWKELQPGPYMYDKVRPAKYENDWPAVFEEAFPTNINTVAKLMIAERGKYVREPYRF